MKPLPESLQLARHVLATPAFFLRWLSKAPPDAAVGTTRNGTRDAIANFLRAYGLEVEVLQGSLRAEGRGVMAPIWVRYLTFQYDRRGWDIVTADQCRFVLYKQTLPAVMAYLDRRKCDE